MKKSKKLQKLTAALLTLFMLCSCTANHDKNLDSGGLKVEENTQKSKKLPKIPDTGYRTGNISFDMTLSDGVRAIEMNVNRSDGVLKVELKSPAEIAGVAVISDAGGVRLSARDCELGISEEGADAFKTLFSAFDLDLSSSDATPDGEGGALYTWHIGEYELMLRLNGEGIPIKLICSGNGMTREGTIENFRIS